VGDQDMPGVSPERQLARWPATGARPDVPFGDQAALDELADPRADEGPTQPRARHQLGARAGSPEADLVEDQDERIERLVGQRGVWARRGASVGWQRCGHGRDDTPAIGSRRPDLLRLTGERRMKVT